jgi:hypothetical protein
MLDTLERVADRLSASRKSEAERERALAERQRRKAQRGTVRLEYKITPSGKIEHEGRTYEARAFLMQVVAPLRVKSWVAFRAYATPETAFGTVVSHRKLLLEGSNEFDTYWDNVSPAQTPPAPAEPAPAEPAPVVPPAR